MPIPWLIVLQNIPWREVITNAPRVADEAKKLWTNLSRGQPSLEVDKQKNKQLEKPLFSSDERGIDLIHSKIMDLEASLDDVHNQMLASTKLIKALADQNTQLVQHIEKNRQRLTMLSLAFFVLFIAFVLFVVRYAG